MFTKLKNLNNLFASIGFSRNMRKLAVKMCYENRINPDFLIVNEVKTFIVVNFWWYNLSIQEK